MKRFIITAFLVVTLFVLQGSIFSLYSTGETVPNLLLILTVSLGLMRGKKTGIIVGFFSGLLLDIFCGPVIGFFALVYMHTGYMAGFFNRMFYPEDIKMPMGIIALTDIIYGFVCYIFFALLDGKLDIVYYFTRKCIPECVYTTLVTIILYPLIMIINRHLEQSERKKEKKFV